MMHEEKKIYINLDNDKKITLDLENVDLKTVEWSKIIPNLEKVLKNTLILSDYEEYLAFQKRVNRLGIMNIKEYDEKWIDYALYTLDDLGNKKSIDPKTRFNPYFKDWYSFLNRDTTMFITDTNEL